MVQVKLTEKQVKTHQLPSVLLSSPLRTPLFVPPYSMSANDESVTYKDQTSDEARFLVAVMYGFVDVLDELYQPEYVEMPILQPEGHSAYIWCGSEFNDNRNPRTNEIDESLPSEEEDSRIWLVPGETPLSIAQKGNLTEVLEFFSSRLIKSANKT